MQLAGKLHRFFQRQAAFGEFAAVKTHAQRPRGRPHIAQRARHPQREAHPVFRATAVGIFALITQRREELVQQVAIRRVQLDKIDARIQRPFGGGDKTVDNPRHPGFVKFLRHAPTGLIGQR